MQAGQLTVVGAVYDFRNDLLQGAGKLSVVNVNGNTEPERMTAFVEAIAGKKDEKGAKGEKGSKEDKARGSKPVAKLDDTAAAAAIADQIAKLRRTGTPEVEAHAVGKVAQE